jgi:hypothetical protein
MFSRGISLLYVWALFTLSPAIINCSAGGKFSPSGPTSLGTSSTGGTNNPPPGPPPSSAPSAPSNFQAAADRATSIVLNWNDTSNNETAFKIEMKTGANGNFVQIATASSNITSFRAVNLLASTPYTFRIRASNSLGDSTLVLSTVVTTPSAGNTATFSYQFANLIETNCLDCHGNGLNAVL